MGCQYCSTNVIEKPSDLKSICVFGSQTPITSPNLPMGTYIGCFPLTLGRSFIKDIFDQYNIYTSGSKYVYLYPPPNVAIFLYTSNSQTSSQYVDSVTGSYFIENGVGTDNMLLSINSDSLIIDVVEYPNGTFIANCVNSSNTSTSHTLYGGASKTVCGDLFDNSNLAPFYPVSKVGNVPTAPQPTPYDGSDTNETSNSWWVWLIIGLIFIVVVIIVLITGFLNSQQDYPNKKFNDY